MGELNPTLDRLGIVPVYREDKIDGSDEASISYAEAVELANLIDAILTPVYEAATEGSISYREAIVRVIEKNEEAEYRARIKHGKFGATYSAAEEERPTEDFIVGEFGFRTLNGLEDSVIFVKCQRCAAVIAKNDVTTHWRALHPDGLS